MIYQLMFAIITPALITGAFAERMKFSAMAVFLSLWSLLVYCPMAHMVWGVGGLLNATGGAHSQPRFCRRHGGAHHQRRLRAGVRAVLGKRIGYPQTAMPPHSLVLSFIGACLLWVGWFGFNAGSALGASPLATSAFINTHFATATAALGWTIFEWFHNGKPTALGAISGAVAGLVAITPASGLCAAHVGAAHRPCRRLLLLLHGLQGQKPLWLRRLARRLWRARRGRNAGRDLTGVFATVAINPIFGKGVATGRHRRTLGPDPAISLPAWALLGASPSSAR